MVQPFCGLVRRFVWWFWAYGFLRLSAHWGPACQPRDLQDFRVLALAVPCPPWPGTPGLFGNGIRLPFQPL